MRMTKRAGRYTLSLDVGGSHIKAAVIGKTGDLVSEIRKTDTPKQLTPARLVREIVNAAKGMPHYDRVAVGIPGVVSRNVVYSLPVSGAALVQGIAAGRRAREPARHARPGDE